MPISESKISEGKCFVTSTFQVRRVIAVNGDTVTYESRGKRARGWSSRQDAKKATFASAVEREVSCDYDPDFSE